MAKYTEAQAKAAKKYLSRFAEIRIRITPEEKAIIERKAKEQGLSVNQYLKGLALQ